MVGREGAVGRVGSWAAGIWRHVIYSQKGGSGVLVLSSLVPSCLSMQPSPQIVSPTFRVWLLLPSSDCWKGSPDMPSYVSG